MSHRYGGGFSRPRQRSNVRVTGCCLPIPLTMLAALTVSARAALRRR